KNLHAGGGSGGLALQHRQRIECQLGELAVAGGAQKIVPQPPLFLLQRPRLLQEGAIERLAVERREPSVTRALSTAQIEVAAGGERAQPLREALVIGGQLISGLGDHRRSAAIAGKLSERHLGAAQLFSAGEEPNVAGDMNIAGRVPLSVDALIDARGAK